MIHNRVGMKPQILGAKYDKIARWWHERISFSGYGIKQIEKALQFCTNRENALDVGCGAGGRFVRKLQEQGFQITGLDVSQEMIELARENHPNESFYVYDICNWETEQKFDFILAWDSIFHLPFSMQETVVSKLCNLLAKNGILTYTFGDGYGEHTDEWHEEQFYYSSIGINGNLSVLMKNEMMCKHLELDQFPENHIYVIAQKL